MAPMLVTIAKPEQRASGQIVTSAPGARPDTLERTRLFLARLDPLVRAIVLRWMETHTTAGPARAWIIRSVLVSVAPELITHPALLAAMSEAVIEIAQARSPEERAPPRTETIVTETGPSTADANERRDVARPPADIASEVATAPPEPKTSMPPGVEPGSDAERATPAPLPPDQPRFAATDEVPSAAAGLFLIVRPLVLMGLPEWLERHPDLAADGFGRMLLHDIARKMHVPGGDPAFAVLARDPATDGFADAIGQLTAWRVGLDRWLRRRARIRLAEVVRRRGWITASGDALSVRFRVDAADLRLRRHALDIDPGWVSFLGLVVRYHYRDELSG